MRESLSVRLLALTLVALLSFAFATGTRAAALPDQDDLRLQALILDGLSPLDLCQSGDDGMPHQHELRCSFCIAFAQPDLPLTSAAEVELRYVTLVVRPRMRRAEGHRHDPSVPPRGPPPSLLPTA